MILSKFLKGTALALAFVVLAGCATRYRGPSDYVPYSSDAKVKSANQNSLVGAPSLLRSTYDDEFVYDAKGNVLKHKQTEYFAFSGKDPKFVVWETEFKQVGESILPSKVSINGVTFLEVTYEILLSQSKGFVTQGTRSRMLRQDVFNLMIFGYVPLFWTMNLSEYPVDFKADDKFIVRQKSFSQYTGIESDNILTLGYDNIVLKHYSYSFEKRSEGYTKSFPEGLTYLQSANANAYKGSTFQFDYEWKVIGGQICQTKTQFKRNSTFADIDFVVNSEYNEAGQRTAEEWTANDTNSKSQTPITVFKQTLKY